MASTGVAVPRNTCSVVEPTIHLRTPPRPCVPITITSVASAEAISRITSAGRPTRILRATFHFGIVPAVEVASTNCRSAGSVSASVRSIPSRIFAASASKGSTAWRTISRASGNRTRAHANARRECSEKSTGHRTLRTVGMATCFSRGSLLGRTERITQRLAERVSSICWSTRAH